MLFDHHFLADLASGTRLDGREAVAFEMKHGPGLSPALIGHGFQPRFRRCFTAYGE